MNAETSNIIQRAAIIALIRFIGSGLLAFTIAHSLHPDHDLNSNKKECL